VQDSTVCREGKMAIRLEKPYPIPYAVLVPRQSECENLLVTFAVSASHVAFGSVRMEPAFMILSQSAGTAACQAIDNAMPVQKVDYANLRKRLRSDAQILDDSP
jgi:hypothetical protein